MRARGVAWAVAIVVALLGGTPGVHADPPELERRLKAADVPASTRRKVRKAIDRACAFLVAQQSPDGSFTEHGGPNPRLAPTVVTLHAALALRHAGTPKGDAALAKAEAWLFDGGEARVAYVAGRVDATALALLLLHADAGRDELVQRFAAALIAALDEESGWWGLEATEVSPGGAPAVHDEPNLDASRLAVLGLLAARARGIDVPTRIWERHARSLVSTQTAKHHAWPRAWSERGGAGDTVATLLGLTDLLAVQGAWPDAPDGLAADVAGAIDRARGVLGRDAGRTLEDPLGHFEVVGDDEGIVLPPGRKPPFDVVGKQVGRRDPLLPGVGAFSRLFAAECACRFADLETLETHPQGKSVTGRSRLKAVEVACYETAARWILSVQQRRGGFAPEADDARAKPSETDTALALLVLTRAASAWHPVHPASIDAPAR